MAEITPSQEFFQDGGGTRAGGKEDEDSGVEFLGEGDEGFKRMLAGKRERSRDGERIRKKKKTVSFL